jgi:hypothetical protein
MWKHKIIEDLLLCLNARISTNERQFIENTLQLLKNSVSFYLENYNDKRLCFFPAKKEYHLELDFVYENMPFDNILIFNDSGSASLLYKFEEATYFLDFRKRGKGSKHTELIGVWTIQRYLYSFNYKTKEKNVCVWSNEEPEHKYKTIEDVFADRIGIQTEDAKELVARTPQDVSFHQLYQRAVTLFNLLNCKNVFTEEIFPSEKLNKKRIRNGKTPIYSYKVLNYEPNYLRKKHRSDNLNDPKYHVRLHFCRGHIKTYTEQNKLFGKITGSFWWEPFIRGDDEEGEIDKDYLIK